MQRMSSHLALCAVMSALTLPSLAQEASFGIERGTGKVICTDDADRPVTGDDTGYQAAALWDRMVLGESPCGPQLTPLDNGTWGGSRPFAGADAEGRTADFRLYVLHERFSWTLGSDRQIEEARTPVMFNQVLQTPEFFARFCGAKSVLSVGAASHEGPTDLNHRLSSNRAAIVVRALTDARESCSGPQLPVLFAVSLGEHQNTSGCTSDGGCAGNTAAQRRLVIVAAEQMTIGINLREALQQALSTQKVFTDFAISDYDLFEVEAF